MNPMLTLFDELLARVPEARARGVLSFSIGDVSMTLADAPPTDEAPQTAKVADDPGPTNALHDALSYGLPPGAKVPGFDPPERPAPQEEDA